MDSKRSWASDKRFLRLLGGFLFSFSEPLDATVTSKVSGLKKFKWINFRPVRKRGDAMCGNFNDRQYQSSLTRWRFSVIDAHLPLAISLCRSELHRSDRCC
jgi:hypothetical protein